MHNSFFIISGSLFCQCIWKMASPPFISFCLIPINALDGFTSTNANARAFLTRLAIWFSLQRVEAVDEATGFSSKINLLVMCIRNYWRQFTTSISVAVPLLFVRPLHSTWDSPFPHPIHLQLYYRIKITDPILRLDSRWMPSSWIICHALGNTCSLRFSTRHLKSVLCVCVCACDIYLCQARV